MTLGPIGRLKLFGFFCPCHESDEEHLARVGADNLRSIKVDWRQTDELSVTATISVLDRPLGPTFQLLCSDPAREAVKEKSKFHTEYGNQLYVEIALYELCRVELVEDDSEINIYVRAEDEEKEAIEKPTPILRFVPTVADPIEVEEDLTSVQHWDRERRADIEAMYELGEAGQRLREEKQRLLDEEGEL